MQKQEDCFFKLCMVLNLKLLYRVLGKVECRKEIEIFYQKQVFQPGHRYVRLLLGIYSFSP